MKNEKLRMKNCGIVGVASLLVASLVGAAEVDLGTPEVERALAGVRPGTIRAHMSFLADDALEGRGTGSRGYDVAARYVAAQLASYGFEPAGTQGTYLQPVPLREGKVNSADSSMKLQGAKGPVELNPRSHYLLLPIFTDPKASVSAPLVFVGYGITAPERSHDDYSRIAVRGKVVVILSGAPASFPTAVRAHYSSSLEKARNAAVHGAVGLINVRTEHDEASYPFAKYLRDTSSPRLRAVGTDGSPIDVFPELKAWVLMSRAGATRLFLDSGHTFDQILADAKQSRLRSFAFPARASIRTSTTYRDLTSPNVVGMLRGSDSHLRNEYVVFTAHLDHLGKGQPVNGDGIYNGAADNASGVAGLLEVARTFSRLSPAPKRSVLLLFVTAEEKGLLGSSYFANYPTVPIGSIVANFNVDMLLMFWPLADIVALGDEHSSLGEVARRAAARLNLQVSPDPLPDEAFFVRSDQYSFVRKGVPAIFMDAGPKSPDPAFSPEKIMSDWLRRVYHTTRDDMSQSFDFATGAKLVRAHFLMGYIVANSTERPRWNEGDFFGAKFGGH
jgi:peptidase M28-like protein